MHRREFRDDDSPCIIIYSARARYYYVRSVLCTLLYSPRQTVVRCALKLMVPDFVLSLTRYPGRVSEQLFLVTAVDDQHHRLRTGGGRGVWRATIAKLPEERAMIDDNANSYFTQHTNNHRGANFVTRLVENSAENNSQSKSRKHTIFVESVIYIIPTSMTMRATNVCFSRIFAFARKFTVVTTTRVRTVKCAPRIQCEKHKSLTKVIFFFKGFSQQSFVHGLSSDFGRSV